MKHARGGGIGHRPPATDDTIPVKVSPAEVWLTQKVYDRLGHRTVEAINGGRETVVHIVPDGVWPHRGAHRDMFGTELGGDGD